MNPGLAWALLVVGGLFEVGFTTCLRYVEGFRNLPWTLGFATCATASVVLLQAATKVVPMGTAYAVWAGIGALGTVTVGIWGFGEPATAVRIALLVVLVTAIVGLRLVH